VQQNNYATADYRITFLTSQYTLDHLMDYNHKRDTSNANNNVELTRMTQQETNNRMAPKNLLET
jgi:hypothetical protein